VLAHRLKEALRSGSIVVNHGTGDPSEARDRPNRGLGGADGVFELAQWIESSTTFSQ
jgi:hypothetical protein